MSTTRKQNFHNDHVIILLTNKHTAQTESELKHSSKKKKQRSRYRHNRPTKKSKRNTRHTFQTETRTSLISHKPKNLTTAARHYRAVVTQLGEWASARHSSTTCARSCRPLLVCACAPIHTRAVSECVGACCVVVSHVPRSVFTSPARQLVYQRTLRSPLNPKPFRIGVVCGVQSSAPPFRSGTEPPGMRSQGRAA